MRRRAFLPLLIASAASVAAGAAAQPNPTAQRRDLEAWWARQREKEEADRFWNGPRERRRNLTRDQIERWEEQRGYRGQGPTGLAGPSGPYGPYGFSRRFH